MSAITALLIALIRAFLPAMAQAAKDSSCDAASNTTQADALRKKIRATWGSVGATLLIALICSGCFTRTIYVPHGTPVRLREPIKAAPVWVLDNENRPVKGVMDLPEGWYALPMDKEDK